MTKVDRQPVVDGDTELIFDCALRADGTSPATVLLFRDGEDEVREIGLRPSDWAFFEDLVEAVAWGEELPRRGHNYLHDGVWELKVDALRATFFDTDGAGGYTPKLGRESWEVGQGRRRIYEPDEMDDYVRLGHWFVKTGQKAGQEQLDAAFLVREEDLDHDRRAEESSRHVEDTNPPAIA